MKTILLVDGSNFLYRAFYAMPDLSTSLGVKTGAVRGFLSMLRTLREDVPTDYLACVFDPKGKTFRSEIYQDYKANRPPTPEELSSQIPLLFEGIEALGIPLLQISGIEADDTIGTISKQAQAEGFKVVIATGDKDFAQLVNEQVVLVNTMGKDNTWMDAKAVEQKFLVPPSKIIDYLSLMGDKIDNVPGVPKCGPKTAATWLKEFGSLEGVIENSDKVSGKAGENLRSALGFLPIAKSLVTIKTDANLGAAYQSLDSLRQKEVDREKLYDYYVKMEFRTWAKELKKGDQAGSISSFSSTTSQHKRVAVGASVGNVESLDLFSSEQTFSSEKKLTVISGEQEAKDFLKTLLGAPRTLSLYLLYSGQSQQEWQPQGLCFAQDTGVCHYLPISEDWLNPQGLSQELFKKLLDEIFSSSQVKLVGYDVKSLRHAFKNALIEAPSFAEDVMLQSYVLEAHRSHAIEKLASNWLKCEIASEEELLGKGVKKKSFSDISVEEAADFAAQRALAVFQLAKVFNLALSKEPALEKIYREIEMPLSLTLFKMEQNGVLIDSQLLARQTQELAQKASQLEQKAFEIAGESFKLSSPKQLGEILFDKLGAQINGSKPKKTLSGSYSTSEEVLNELAPDYPLAKVALDYRTIVKLMTTYTEKLPKMVDRKDGRIHTTFEQAVAVTGRLSSTNPNLQNIPIRSEEGKKVREAFIAKPGCKLISADYSQIELRIMAHLSGDSGLISAFNHHEDIHRATAAEVFGKSKDEVTADDRRVAKVINFGLIYGMSAFGLAKNLGIERGAAKNYIAKYFERYPKVLEYMDSTRVLAQKQGYVQTAYGRRLWLPEIHAAGARRAAAERAAINAPMQGTAADLIKMSMNAVQKWIEEEKLQSRLILQVHDELIMEVPLEEVDLVKKRLPEIMDSVATLHIPLVAEVGVGDNWEAAH